MNEINTSTLLAQMRAMAAQSSAKLPGSEMALQASDAAKPAVSESSFSNVLAKSINEVNSVQMQAAEMTKAFETGAAGVDLADVMVSLQKADISFKAMTEVRNKLVSAYQDIMNMPV